MITKEQKDHLLELIINLKPASIRELAMTLDMDRHKIAEIVTVMVEDGTIMQTQAGLFVR